MEATKTLHRLRLCTLHAFVLHSIVTTIATRLTRSSIWAHLPQEGWLGAEAWDATRQLDAACDAYAAWQPAAEQLLAAAAGEEDMLPETPRSRCAVLRHAVPMLCCAAPCRPVLSCGCLNAGSGVQQLACGPQRHARLTI